MPASRAGPKDILAKVEAQRAQESDELVRHLAAVDARLKAEKMARAGKEQQRRATVAFQKQHEPPGRAMFNDKTLSLAAQIPGPGQYTPRMNLGVGRNSHSKAGRTFGESADQWPVQKACVALNHLSAGKDAPGPDFYSPRRDARRAVNGHSGGKTFGLPEDLRPTTVPSAHDISYMTKHLEGLPAPDAYSPQGSARGPTGGSVCRRPFVPSNARSYLEQVQLNSSWVPGPGTYETGETFKGGTISAIMGASSAHASLRSTGMHPGLIRSDLDMTIDRARELPGPGEYECTSSLRSKGSPRFSKAGGMSEIEVLQAAARTKPGPGAHFPTATFAEELETDLMLRESTKAAIHQQSKLLLSQQLLGLSSTSATA